MISSLKSVDGSCAAYIGAVGERQAIQRNAPDCAGGQSTPVLQQFHEYEPCLKPPSGLRSPFQG
jgi:hypothetical protein